MADFSKASTAKGFFAPMRFEADIYDCEVVGKIPEAMNGAFVRVGGDWLYPSLSPEDAPFNADGYISMFRFKNGIVDFKGRFVKTPRFVADHAARRQLYGNYRNPFTDDPSVRDPAHPNRRTVSNTNTLAHGGKLFTLKEDGLPYEIDPKTLDTIGPWDFHGKYKSQTFTAHPKLDPVTGQLIAFGYEATGLETTDIWIYYIDKAGQVTREIKIQSPYVAMLHDIALTQKHIVIPVCGMVSSMERLHEGKVHWGWDSSKPTYYGILPRDGEAKDLRWFKGPERGTVHTFNARTEGDKVILEAPFYDSNPFPFFPAIDGSPFNPQKGRAYIRRYTFDLGSKSDGFTEETLFPQNVSDLGRIDDRYISLPYRYAFTGYSDGARPFNEARGGNLKGRVTNTYGRYDLAANKASYYFAGDTHSLQEPCFVPRSKDAPEGDGWIVGVASNYGDMCSELVIADAQHLEDGDVARVIMPFRLSSQVHANWVHENALPLA